MKTTNWQTKALTLFIATVALCLTTACGDRYLTEYPYPGYGLRIVSSELCEIDVSPVPSQELVKLADRRLPPGEAITYEALVKLSAYTLSGYARDTRLAPEFKRIRDVLQTYLARLEKHPYYSFTDVEALRTWDGTPTDRIVIVVYLAHLVDMRTIRPEDRIPGCIAGVPVHIVVGNRVHGNIE